MMGMLKIIILIVSVAIFIILPVASRAESFEEMIEVDSLKKAWGSLKTKRPLEALTLLSEYHHDTADTESRAQYHFIYAKAMEATKKPFDAVEHLRLAYLYSEKSGMKELSLFERAETYLRMNCFHEAKSNYYIFIKNFPDSHYLEKVHLGLAKSLMGIGLFKDAAGQYEKAHNVPEALFGKANALHRLGNIKEANDVYTAAISQDSSYLKKSDETLCYLGENLRLMGRLTDARRYLTAVKDTSFKGKAEISLGLIAAEESKKVEAVNHFRSALLSRDRQVKSQALLNLAEAEIKAGRVNEARGHLEEIRYRYPYGREYERSLVTLSRLYRNEGKLSEALSLLKELVFKQSPPKEALDELEVILLEVKEKDTVQFMEHWKYVGQRLLDRSRMQFLLKIAEALENTGQPFLEITTWLSKHGSDSVKTKSLSVLAEFYADMGDISTAQKYLRNIRAMKGSGDEIIRVEAKILYNENDFKSVSEKLMSIKNMQQVDLKLLGTTLTSAKDINKALAFYQRAIKEKGGNSEDYMRLADILYERGKKTDALKYYRLALSKDQENEWALYKIAEFSDVTEAEEMLKRTKKGNSVFSSMARVRLRELSITRKMSELF